MHNKLLLLLLLAFISPHLHSETCVPWSEDSKHDATLVVGAIDIDSDNVFDINAQDQSTKAHALANKIHIKTKKSVIENQLLIGSGETLNLRKLKENERELRANRYIKDAEITPTTICDNAVNLKIQTRDNWTLSPSISFGTSGGKNKSGAEIQEHNLFGLGKSILIGYKDNQDRTSSIFSYSDPQLLGTRKQLGITLQNNSDGEGYNFHLGQPYIELDSKSAWGVASRQLDQTSTLYENSQESFEVDESLETHTLFIGRSEGLNNNKVSRYNIGWTYDKYNSVTSDSVREERIESYPWFEYVKQEENYITKKNFNTMGKIEDISLGTTMRANFGLLSQQLGSDDDYLKLGLSFSKGFEFNKYNLGFINFDNTTYIGSGALKGEEYKLSTEWYNFDDDGSNYHVFARFSSASNLRAGEQYLIGGGSAFSDDGMGLRGYPFGFQNGNKSFLLTAEKRFHFDWYPYSVAKFGAVAFVDIGSAWQKNSDLNVLADVGIGLRFIPTRSSSSKTLNLDLAFPLTETGQVDSYQLVIKSSTRF